MELKSVGALLFHEQPICCPPKKAHGADGRQLEANLKVSLVDRCHEALNLKPAVRKLRLRSYTKENAVVASGQSKIWEDRVFTLHVQKWFL